MDTPLRRWIDAVEADIHSSKPAIIGCYCSWMEPWSPDVIAVTAGVRSVHPNFPGLHMCYFADGKCTLDGGPVACHTHVEEDAPHE